MRRTKIVASIGPASWDEPVLRKTIAAGADVIRINLSHGEPAARAADLAGRLGPLDERGPAGHPDGVPRATNLADDSQHADVLKKYQTLLKELQQQYDDPWVMKWDYE